MEERVVPMSKSQIRQQSQSLQRFMSMSKDIKKDLAGAIICVAADDYRLARRTRNTALRKEVESFFRSDWFRMLSDLEPEYILKLLNEEKLPRKKPRSNSKK